MREHSRGTWWRHAAARVGAVAVLAGVLAGGGPAGALLGGWLGSHPLGRGRAANRPALH
jgi:hypothetical protein